MEDESQKNADEVRAMAARVRSLDDKQLRKLKREGTDKEQYAAASQLNQRALNKRIERSK